MLTCDHQSRASKFNSWTDPKILYIARDTGRRAGPAELAASPPGGQALMSQCRRVRVRSKRQQGTFRYITSVFPAAPFILPSTAWSGEELSGRRTTTRAAGEASVGGSGRAGEGGRDSCLGQYTPHRRPEGARQVTEDFFLGGVSPYSFCTAFPSASEYFSGRCAAAAKLRHVRRHRHGEQISAGIYRCRQNGEAAKRRVATRCFAMTPQTYRTEMPSRGREDLKLRAAQRSQKNQPTRSLRRRRELDLETEEKEETAKGATKLGRSRRQDRQRVTR